MLKKLTKDIVRKLFNFDVSPLGTGGLSKFFIFLIWGLNAILFIGDDYFNIYKYNPQPDNTCSVCTVTKKISKVELFSEISLFINTREFVIISSYDFKIPHYDVIINPLGRAPPALLHS
jgi:hypothetical protein